MTPPFITLDRDKPPVRLGVQKFILEFIPVDYFAEVLQGEAEAMRRTLGGELVDVILQAGGFAAVEINFSEQIERDRLDWAGHRLRLTAIVQPAVPLHDPSADTS